MKLGELAARLGCKLEGDADAEVHGVAGIESAQAGEVTFLSNPKYSRQACHDAGVRGVRRRKDCDSACRRAAVAVGSPLGESVFRFRAGYRACFPRRLLTHRGFIPRP